MAKIHVSRVIERLERLLAESPDSTCDGKTEKVIKDMRIIQDFMEKQNLTKRSRLDYFISDIVDMVHEALNVMDDLTIYAKISPLQRWVGEVKIRLLNFGLNGVEMRSQSVGVEADGGDDLSVVGLEKDVKQLLSTTVFNKRQGFQTSTIKGMTGIGKTTLARQVYNNVDVRDQFKCRAWVRVSSELSHKEVLMKLIQEVVHWEEVERDSLLRKMEYADNRILRQMLHQRLQGMRYFIVLDDWQEDMCLRSILKGLPHEDKGSRLLLTNRTYCMEESIYYDYEMTPLDPDRSWELLLKTSKPVPNYLQKGTRERLAKCCGLPLAIKDLGRELAGKTRSGRELKELLKCWQSVPNQHIVPTNKAKDLIISMIRKLGRLLVELPDTCKRKIREVIDELKIILDFLGENESGNGSRLHYFISDIVDMVIEALDVKDDNLSIYDISFLNRSVIEVKMRMFKLGVDEAKMRSETVRIEEDYDDDKDVVGLEEYAKKLLQTAIFNEEQCLQTSTITGMVGIGKTALARQVYNHVDVRDRFKCRAWVRVSSELSYKELLIKLVQQVVHCEELERDSLLSKMEMADNRTLRQMLHQRLQGMRYFIVLDDWQEDMCLRSILKGLPHEDKGSRLLLTNRTYCMEESIYYDYEMTPLDSINSWELLLKTEFSSEHKFPKHLENKGREMLTKCCGLPLAVKDVGRQLAEKRRSGIEWEDLLEYWQCMPNQDIVPTNMAKALIIRMIRKLERSLVELPDSCKGKMGEVINELKIILDFLGEKESGNGSRLDYFISDIVDMVREALDVKDDNLSIYDKISFLNRSVIEVKVRMFKLGVDEAKKTSETVGVEESDDDDKDVVGLEEDVKKLLQRVLFNEEQCLQTSTITGMVGIGKTALARQVYNHVDVRQFERRAWVRVSSELSYKELLIKLIQKVIDCEEVESDLLLEKLENADNRSLKQTLHQNLQGMRYFIVLDDWPKEMCLRYILKGLPDEDKGSRLLLIRRSRHIKETIHYNHGMKYLDPAKSWQLFTKTIFGGNKLKDELKFPQHLKSRGKQLLTECGGLPFAIKHVGSQIVEKRLSGSEWEQILESVDFSAILEFLEPFYQELDRAVKSSFLHLAFFKENTTVRTEKLMTLIWAVGGMASEEEIAKSIHEMIEESIIEVDDYPIKRFRVNALLHKLSTKKAEEEIGFEMVRNNGNNRSSHSPCHRAIYCSRDKFNYSTDKNEHLVSLFFRGGGPLDVKRSYWESYKVLKVLDLEDFGIKKLPESIGTLTELRYLGLRNNFLQELPRSLGGLKNLEVLDIALNSMVEVPHIISELSSLRLLYLSNVIYQESWKSPTESLETLTYISADHWCGGNWWPKVHKLCKLGIEEVDGNSKTINILAPLMKKQQLKYLTLRGFRFRSMPSMDNLHVLHSLHTLKLDGRLASLPSVKNLPISYLKLVNSCLDEDPMPVLEKLPSLTHLKLRNAYTGKQMLILPKGFPGLKSLFIGESWNLRNVQIGKGAMPRLQKLEIKNCPYLESLPEEIGSMASLEELKMVTTKEIASKIMKSWLIFNKKVVEMLELHLPREFKR